MKLSTLPLLTLVIGAILGSSAVYLLSPQPSTSEQNTKKADEPLYWVAPMDDNYRRDKPGKSPMGMDLVPVYAEAKSSQYGPGAIKIAPNVVNNLGVRTATVTKGNMRNDIATVGYVTFDEDKLIHIHPRVEGWIEKLYVKAAGEPVTAGKPLYTLYSPQLVNAQEEFLITLRRQDKGLKAAAKERLKALQLSDRFISQLEKTKTVQQSVTFYAPQSGVIDGLKIREGFFVKPGNTLMSIGQLEQVWVEAEVFESQTASVKEGLEVSMRLDFLPAREWLGVVDYIYPTLDSKNRTLRVRLKFDNQDLALKPSMFAQIVIHLEPVQDAILVPKEAVIRTGKQNRVVLALEDNQFKSVEVAIGRVNNEYIEILDGLYEGDTIVSSAQFLIDSESSKHSDFKRMSTAQLPSSVWMTGDINSVMANHRMVNITHAAVTEWDWPEMTMDFSVSEDVDFTALAAGQNLHFEVSKTADGQYQITGIHIMSEAMASDFPSATVTGTINQIDANNKVLNISRGPIEKWDRPATTMDFTLAADLHEQLFQHSASEKNSQSNASLSVGDEVIFTFEIRDGDFVIVDIKPAHNDAMSDMDHSQH
ncbi:efflux RND transporter periplasmic adaptor subunit [Thalassotalea aquiviva]|uniref:efflux RND transporter periplasmic adaptor subunit n=1 Tax=Thalassotalea aquiviva TaxID=3242415 RepID=UPI00352A6604